MAGDPFVTFDADARARIKRTVRRVEGSSQSQADGGAVATHIRAFWLASPATYQLWNTTATNWTVFSGNTKGSEASTSITLNHVYLRRGICLSTSIYIVIEIDGALEVMNPTLMVRGQFSADLAPDTAATLQNWGGTNGSESSTGTSFSVWNASACTIKGNKMVTAHWCEDNNTFHVGTGKT